MISLFFTLCTYCVVIPKHQTMKGEEQHQGIEHHHTQE